MAVEVAFAFKSGIQPGSGVVIPTSYGAGSDGSVFVNENGVFVTFDPTAGMVILQDGAVLPNMNELTSCFIAPVSASLCYFIQVLDSVVVSQYSGTTGITNLPPLPNAVVPAAVSASGDGTMWVTGADGIPYAYDPSSSTWSAIAAPPGTLQLISVGSASFILALVTQNDGTNTIEQYVAGSWQPLAGAPAGATWIGACLDGSYWSWAGPPTLTLMTGGTTIPFDIPKSEICVFAAANRYGCWAFSPDGGLPNFLQVVALGVIDAAPVPFPSFTGDEETAYSAINARIGITDPNGIRGVYANLDAPLDDYFSIVSSMSCPPGVSDADWTAVQKQITTELLYASAVRNIFANITTLNGQMSTLHLAAYDSVVAMVGLPAQPQQQPSTTVNVILGAIFAQLFDAAMNAAPPMVSKVINLGLDVYKYGADQIAQQHNVPNSDIAFAVACSQLAQTLSDTQVAMTKGTGTFETAILGDWGKLSACGQAVASNYWFWDPNFDYSVLANIGNSIAIDYYQVLMPAKWQIVQIESPMMLGEIGFLPNVPQYAMVYQFNDFPVGNSWSFVCTALGADTSPETTGPFPSQTLIEAILPAVQPSDFFGGTNGWSLPVALGEGYTAPPPGLPFSAWIDSASPATS